MAQFTVDDVLPGEKDANHRRIVDVYAKQSLRYAVYQTEKRVVITFADDPLAQKIQRKRLAPLAVLRSEIDGMLAPWREKPSRTSRLSITARQYDLRVASALIEALEGEAETARVILERIKSDIAGEMASRARLAYVAWSLASALLLFAAGTFIKAIVIGQLAQDHRQAFTYLFAGMCTGLFGALYSIAMGIEKRSLTSDLRRFDHFTDSFVRLGLGAMGAFVIGCFLVSGVIQLNFGQNIALPNNGLANNGLANNGLANSGQADRNFLFLILIAGFLAGFAERLVPDLLNSYAIVPHAPPPPTVPAPPPPAQPGPSVAAPQSARAEPASEDDLIEPPSPEDDIDGCDADLADPALATPDDKLPASSGGVVSHQS